MIPGAETIKTAMTSSRIWLWLLYVLGFVIIVIAVLMLSGYKFETDIMGFFKSRKLTVDMASYEFWKPDRDYSIRIVKGSDLPKSFVNSRYTMSVDMIWFDTRTVNRNGPHRHILHKGSEELKAKDNDESTVFEDGMQTASCASDSTNYSKLPPNGLPRRMNPGLFADPVTNDMIIFIDTEVDNKQVRESIRVPDIPLGVPFRVAITVIDKLIEVYINCRLESTKILRGIPLNVDPEWYRVSGVAALPAMVQNLKIWTTPLSAKDIQTQCGKDPVFKRTQAICAPKTGEEGLGQQEVHTTQSANLGYGTALDKCKRP